MTLKKQKNYGTSISENRRNSKHSDRNKRLKQRAADTETDITILRENEPPNTIIENVNEINVSIEHYVLFHQPVQNQTRVKTGNILATGLTFYAQSSLLNCLFVFLNY